MPFIQKISLLCQNIVILGVNSSNKPNQVCRKVDLHAFLFPDEIEAELHRIDVVISRLRNKARLHGVTLPIRAIFGKGLAFIP